MRQQQYSVPQAPHSDSLQGRHAPCPPFSPPIFLPDFEANRLKSLNLRADDFMHPTTFQDGSDSATR